LEVRADQALGGWAVEVIESHSPVPIDPIAATALRQGDVNLQRSDLFCEAYPAFDRFLGVGTLPEGCYVTARTNTPLYATPFDEEAIGLLEAGDYPATDVDVYSAMITQSADSFENAFFEGEWRLGLRYGCLGLRGMFLLSAQGPTRQH
jgi:hypothetical protein